MRILLIGFIIMGQFLFPKPKKHVPYKSSYGNPFVDTNVERLRHKRRQKYEAMAALIKRHGGDKRPLKEIAADLSLAEMRRKK